MTAQLVSRRHFSRRRTLQSSTTCILVKVGSLVAGRSPLIKLSFRIIVAPGVCYGLICSISIAELVHPFSILLLIFVVSFHILPPSSYQHLFQSYIRRLFHKYIQHGCSFFVPSNTPLPRFGKTPWTCGTITGRWTIPGPNMSRVRTMAGECQLECLCKRIHGPIVSL